VNIALDVQGWCSASEAQKGGIELPGAPIPPSGIDSALLHGELAELSKDASFLLIPLASTDSRGVALAIAHASRSEFGARPGLLVDRSTSEGSDTSIASRQRVSLVLDGVDADTPLSALARDSIDAIRFEPAFVLAAFENARLGCVLEAMLSLAHNLGLATFGPAGPSDTDRQEAKLAFDYTPTPRGEPAADGSATR